MVSEKERKSVLRMVAKKAAVMGKAAAVRMAAALARRSDRNEDAGKVDEKDEKRAVEKGIWRDGQTDLKTASSKAVQTDEKTAAKLVASEAG